MNCIKTGFDEYDATFGGLEAGQLIVIAGRPAMGKSTLAMNIVHNVCVDKANSVLVITPKKEGYYYCKRLIELNPRDKISKWKLEVDDTKEVTVEYIDKRIAAMNQVSLVVIDYLQLMVGGKKSNGKRWAQDKCILYGLKALSKKYEPPMLVLSNLSRSCEDREDHCPRLTDLGEETEKIFDEIILLYRADYYRRVDVQDDQEAEVIVVRHPCMEDIPKTIKLTYNCYAGGFTNRIHTRK